MHASNEDCSVVGTSLSIVGRLLVTRHPLETPWCLYYFIQDYVKEKWMECMLPVATVSTLEEFFRCAHALQRRCIPLSIAQHEDEPKDDRCY
jgi:hypothetical protein